MPWSPADATRHDKKVKSPKAKKRWSKVANAILSRTHDEGRAIRGANAATAQKLYGAKK